MIRRTLLIACAALIGVSGAWTAMAQEDQPEKPHFHHIHLNVQDPAKTIDWYGKVFGAVPVKYREVSDALLTDRSFILLSQVSEAAPWELKSGIYHIGWGGYDGPSDFKWRDELGVEWETPLTQLGNNWYMYAYGPDKEVVEVWTGFKHHRFGHVHLLSDNVAEATTWYVDNLNANGPGRIPPKPPAAPADFDPDSGANVFRYLWASAFSTDNGVTINVFAKPSEDTINWWPYEPLGDLVSTDGRSIDHIAFSYRDIIPVYNRMKDNGVEIVDDIKWRDEYAMKSFFVRGPDKVLVEIVEARPLPEGVWEGLPKE